MSAEMWLLRKETITQGPRFRIFRRIFPAMIPFIGYPIWWHTAPMIIGTFLENYDLTGVDVYPFTQSASMDTEQFDNSMEFVRTSAGNGTVHDGLFVDEADTEGIDAYLADNGFEK